MIDGSVLQSAQRCFEKKSRVVVKMVVINPSFRHTIENCNKDRNGRIVSIDLRTDTASISLCNIYAPNDLQQQLGFFAQFEYIFGIQ